MLYDKEGNEVHARDAGLPSAASLVWLIIGLIFIHSVWYFCVVVIAIIVQLVLARRGLTVTAMLKAVRLKVGGGKRLLYDPKEIYRRKAGRHGTVVYYIDKKFD